MGIEDHFISPGAGNRKGFYEDKCLHDLAGGMLGAPELLTNLKDDGFRAEWTEEFSNFISTHRQEPIWGLKNPAFCAIWRFVEPLFSDDVRIVAVHRKFNSVVKSRIRVQAMGEDQATGFHSWSLALMHQELHITDNSIYHLQYEDLVKYPSALIPHALKFCLEGMSMKLDTESAIKFIDPSLRHF